MSKIKTLENYTGAIVAVADFRKKHKKVFEELDSLQIRTQDAEQALKADVKDNHKTNIANDKIKVTYAPAYRKWYDFDIILGMITPKQRKELEEADAITTSLDKKIFEDLVEKGVIPINVKQSSFKEEEMSPRVIIKEVKPTE